MRSKRAPFQSRRDSEETMKSPSIPRDGTQVLITGLFEKMIEEVALKA